MVEVLIVYYSVHGGVAQLARRIARGVESVADATAKIRTLPRVSAETEQLVDEIPSDGPPYASLDDLRRCDAIALGSPTRFGNMAAPVKYFLDRTSEIWVNGELVGKPAGVFTSASSMHGGHESTLLSMQIPLLHHGMLVCGLPYTEAALHETRRGGTPYGPSRLADSSNDTLLDQTEETLAFALGQRLATLAVKLKE